MKHELFFYFQFGRATQIAKAEDDSEYMAKLPSESFWIGGGGGWGLGLKLLIK